jgi:arsenate reductase
MTGRVFNVLFLCTGNSARSILAEAILRKDGEGRFQAFSAGSHATGSVQPLALKVLAEVGYPVDVLRSKTWDEFAVPGAPVMDFVFTVCDDAAGEVCPVWPGQPVTGHWGIADPACVEGTGLECERTFVTALGHMKRRISLFAALPFASLDRASLTATVREIGHADGASTPRASVA